MKKIFFVLISTMIPVYAANYSYEDRKDTGPSITSMTDEEFTKRKKRGREYCYSKCRATSGSVPFSLAGSQVSAQLKYAKCAAKC